MEPSSTEPSSTELSSPSLVARLTSHPPSATPEEAAAAASSMPPAQVSKLVQSLASLVQTLVLEVEVGREELVTAQSSLSSVLKRMQHQHVNCTTASTTASVLERAVTELAEANTRLRSQLLSRRRPRAASKRLLSPSERAALDAVGVSDLATREVRDLVIAGATVSRPAGATPAEIVAEIVARRDGDKRTRQRQRELERPSSPPPLSAKPTASSPGRSRPWSQRAEELNRTAGGDSHRSLVEVPAAEEGSAAEAPPALYGLCASPSHSPCPAWRSANKPRPFARSFSAGPLRVHGRFGQALASGQLTAPTPSPAAGPWIAPTGRRPPSMVRPATAGPTHRSAPNRSIVHVSHPEGARGNQGSSFIAPRPASADARQQSSSSSSLMLVGS